MAWLCARIGHRALTYSNHMAKHNSVSSLAYELSCIGYARAMPHIPCKGALYSRTRVCAYTVQSQLSLSRVASSLRFDPISHFWLRKKREA